MSADDSSRKEPEVVSSLYRDDLKTVSSEAGKS
jgi:hypothetical protein